MRHHLSTIQESLPIVLDLFSIEYHAEEIDTWLDTIIDSKPLLSEYVNLVLLRRKRDHSAQILERLVCWYLTSQNKVSSPSHLLETLV
jgi:hypothetical protein